MPFCVFFTIHRAVNSFILYSKIADNKIAVARYTCVHILKRYIVIHYTTTPRSGYIQTYTTLPTRLHKADRQSGYIQTITQSCLQDHIKQIAGQRHIQTIIQPCLEDRMKQIASQGHIQTIIQPCLQDRIK